MRVLHLFAVATVFSAALMTAQEEPAPPAEVPEAPRAVPPVIASMQEPVKVQRSQLLPDGTAITLRIITEIKAKEARAGDVVELVLDHDLWNGDLLLASEGTAAQAVVVEASKAKWASRGSKLAIEMKGLRMRNGRTLPLRGTPKYRGGVGPGAQLGGGLVTDAATPPDYCPICEIVFVPAAIVSLAAPGANKNVKANTLAIAWVDGDVALDAESFPPFRVSGGGHAAKASIARGSYGTIYNRDLYCNGVPLAHFPAKRKLEIELEPGWYRFAINPKKQPLKLYLAAGSETKLITDYDRVYVVNEPGEAGGKLADSKKSLAPNRSLNTRSPSLNPFSKNKDEVEYLESAKPIDAADRYPTECHPLAEIVSENSK